MDFNDSPEEASFRTQAKAWIAANRPAEGWQNRTGRDTDAIKVSKDWQKKKYDAGWACIHWPKEFGGRGATPIEEFNEYFGVSLSDEEFDTVAGLIMKQLGRLPRRGEILHIGDIEFRVTRADRRRIDTLKVIPPHDVLPLEDRETAD